jgi:hypothetical protein
MNTHAQDDQPPEIKIGTPEETRETLEKLQAYHQRRASQGNPDDPKLDEALTQIEAGVKRQLGRRAEIDDLKQTILEKYIGEVLSCELYPNGYPAARGGYWCVPAPNLIKISYKTGFMFNLEDPDNRHPMMITDGGRNVDIIDLWMGVKGVTFPEAIRDMKRWVKQREKGIPAPAPKGPRRDDAYYSELKREVLNGVFSHFVVGDTLTVTKKRGSALSFYNLMKETFGAD